jgi:hypothetical protein
MNELNSIMKRLLIMFLKAYRYLISPLFPQSCRFTPSCSEYSMEAVERFGAIRGAALAAGRVLKCHPFCDGGYDPVPDYKPVHKEKINWRWPWTSGRS